MRVLLVNIQFHEKNCHAILNYKNIKVVSIYNLNQINNINLTDFDCVYSPSIPIDVSNYPNTKFIFGPHFSVFPENSLQMIKGPNTVYNLLSDWVKDIWVKNYKICNGLRFVTFPFGVDTDRFTEIKSLNERSEIMFYCKSRSPQDLSFIKNFLH